MKASFKHFNILLLILLPALITGGLLSIAGNLSDGLRLGFLSLPGVGLIWLAIKTQKKYWYGLTVLWWFATWLDVLLRSSTWFLFNSDNEAYFIIEAITNTSQQETWEFIQLHLSTILSVIFSLLCLLIIYSISTFKLIKAHHLDQMWQSRIYRSCIVLLVLLTITSYLMKPSRKVHPIIFWSDYQTKLQDFKNRIKQHQNVHRQWDISAKQNLTLTKNRMRNKHMC